MMTGHGEAGIRQQFLSLVPPVDLIGPRTCTDN